MAAPTSLLVEVVNTQHSRAGLLALLGGFDIGPCAIGAELDDGAVVASAVHPLARASALLRSPLLLPGLPNQEFMLATAERALRYAERNQWAHPARVMDELIEVFNRATSGDGAAGGSNGESARARLVRNHRSASVCHRNAARVRALFGVTDDEWRVAGVE